MHWMVGMGEIGSFPLKLATEIIELNEGFSKLLSKKGHMWKFEEESSKENLDAQLEYEKKAEQIQGSGFSVPELQQLVGHNIGCSPPVEKSIMDHIERCYKESRGPELGTV
jgi:hypothetical protein